ncbi:hypothetical protein BDV12DRAFT_169159 [Aspergillus spectabilis]
MGHLGRFVEQLFEVTRFLYLIFARLFLSIFLPNLVGGLKSRVFDTFLLLIVANLIMQQHCLSLPVQAAAVRPRRSGLHHGQDTPVNKEKTFLGESFGEFKIAEWPFH